MPKQRSGVTFAELFFGRSSRNAGDTLRFQWRLQCEQAATGVAMNRDSLLAKIIGVNGLEAL
jgi:hypothetical protein